MTSVGRWALALLGRDPRRFVSTAACLQCGDPSRVCVIRLGPRGARYWCLRCGAVVTESDRAAVRPLATLRPSRVDPPGGSVFARYDRWDSRHPQPRLPSFAVVVNTLHEACYRVDLAVAALPGEGPALRARVAHAHRWLYLHGQQLCWIHEPARTGPAAPAPARVAAVLAALRAGERLDRHAAPVLRAALFGTTAGPKLRSLLMIWTRAELAAALAGYLETGRRPLRVEVLATLNGTRG